jgi:hypothetical protein
MNDETVNKIAYASMGVSLYVIGHSKPGILGTFKELLATKKGLKSNQDGPAKDLIKAAEKEAMGSRIQNEISEQVKSLDRDKLTYYGEKYMAEGVDALKSLDSEQAEHVSNWLYGIAQLIAERVTEKGQDQAVSAEEQKALDHIKQIYNV